MAILTGLRWFFIVVLHFSNHEFMTHACYNVDNCNVDNMNILPDINNICLINSVELNSEILAHEKATV